jgi:hypothetical protein
MKSPPHGVEKFEYEMGYAAGEFGSVLNGPFSGDKSDYHCQEISSHNWRIDQADHLFQIQIQVSEQPPRKLGLFCLPVLRVEFELLNTSPELQDRFFERFFKYFHKGGG